MTKHDWAVLACKVLALWALLKGVVWGASDLLSLVALICIGLVQDSSDFEWFSFLWMLPTAVPAVASLVLAWVLWTKADRVAVRMMGPEAGPSETPPLEYEGLLSAAVATVGVVLVFLAIPRLIGTIVWAIYCSFPENNVSYDGWRVVAISLTQIFLGLWLTVGTKQVVRLLRRLRTFGVRTAEGPPEA